MTRPSLATILYGTDEPIAAAVALRAGPLTMTLEEGKLWNLCIGDIEVWHGLGFVYRDVGWGTPKPVIAKVDSRVDDDHFVATIAGRVADPSLSFELRIEGHADGRLEYSAEAVPTEDLRTNRTGLCLMHPMSVCGARVEIEHVDGRTSASTFPTLVPAWPPFMLIRSIRHE